MWVSQGRFSTEKALPVQTLGHIQHTYEDLSELHTMVHHRCWRLIHGELSQLTSPKWRFVCINSGKCFRTVWKELDQEFPEVFDHWLEQTLWNEARDTELRRPLTQSEEMRRQKGIPHEQIAQDRFWNKRPDGIAFKMPTTTKAGVIFLLEFKRMSDVTNHYIVRAKHEAEEQYESHRSTLTKSMQRQGWMVNKYLCRGSVVPKWRGSREKPGILQGSLHRRRTHANEISYENIWWICGRIFR